MNENDFALEILTPNRTVFKGSVTSLVAPAALGYLGVLANHAPMMTTLTPGKVTYRDAAGNPHDLRSTGSGFLDVFHNQVTLLADGIEGAG